MMSKHPTNDNLSEGTLITYGDEKDTLYIETDIKDDASLKGN